MNTTQVVQHANLLRGQLPESLATSTLEVAFVGPHSVVMATIARPFLEVAAVPYQASALLTQIRGRTRLLVVMEAGTEMEAEGMDAMRLSLSSIAAALGIEPAKLIVTLD